MMKPNANEMPSRSAPVTAGFASPARASVATTDPGPTRTSIAVPSASDTARWPSEYVSSMGPPRGLRFGIIESCSAGTYSPDRSASSGAPGGGEQFVRDVVRGVRAGEPGGGGGHLLPAGEQTV